MVSSAAVVIAAGYALAAPPVFTPLGPVGIVATGMSADGTIVVGAGGGGVQRWTGGTWTNIGGYSGSTPAISRDGSTLAATALEAGTNYQTAGLWLGGTSWQTLGGLGSVSGSSQSTAYGVSGDGSVVVGLGWICPVAFECGRAFRWDATTGMNMLETIGGPGSRANGIAADGLTIVGWQQIATRVPAVWVNGVQTVLNPTGAGEVWAANADGTRIAGWDSGNAMVWAWNGSAWDAQTIGFFTASHSGRANAISDDGSVVAGQCSLGSLPPFTTSALYWTQATGPVELKPYLESLGTVGMTNYALNRIIAMTPDGRTLLGVGTTGIAAFPNASFMVTFPDSCYADCNASGSLTIADFGCFQAKFAAGDMYADCNTSGTLTIADFGCFQSSFAAGCP
jgi:uncharacterized membrane protein